MIEPNIMMTEAVRPRPRFQPRIQSLMIAVAVVAVGLAMPRPTVAMGKFVGMVAVVLALLIAVPTALARRGRRGVVALRAAVVHPLVILVWLGLVRLIWFRQPLDFRDRSLVLAWTLGIPYVVAFLSLYYVPILFLMGFFVLLGASRGWRRVPAIATLPVVWLALPAVWIVTWITMLVDPFQLSLWVRD